MHFHGLGDIVQDQCLHRLVSVLEKITLVLDDTARHLQQGLITTLQALDEPARLL